MLAAAVASERARGGSTLVATSDRDAFQLAADDVTILQPQRGVSELARIGPAEVRERYGVEPWQVPDFIALRGDPSDKIPGRAVSARRRPPRSSPAGRRSSRSSPSGRFAAEADALRRYRHVATLDPTLPLPDAARPDPRLAGVRGRGANGSASGGSRHGSRRLRED